MAIRRRERIRINQFLILLTGGILMACAIWVFLLIVNSIYGRYSLGDVIPTPRNVQAAFSSKEKPVAVLSSGYSVQLLDPASTWLQDNVKTWVKFISSNGLRHDVISDPDIESGQLEKYELVVLPCARAMSDSEIVGLRKYIGEGGSVFATGATGSCGEDGRWRGWGFLSEVFGIQYSKEITPTEATKAHTLRGGLPITAGIPSGYLLEVATWDRPMACEILEPRATLASFWYNLRSDTGLVAEVIDKSAGIVYGN